MLERRVKNIRLHIEEMKAMTDPSIEFNNMDDSSELKENMEALIQFITGTISDAEMLKDFVIQEFLSGERRVTVLEDADDKCELLVHSVIK